MEASSLRCVAFVHKQLSEEDQEYDTKDKIKLKKRRRRRFDTIRVGGT